MTIRRRVFTFFLLFLMVFGLVTCTNLGKQQPNSSAPTAKASGFRVWWQQGFYPEETEAIRQMVADWEKKSGMKADLTFYSDKDIVRETNNALKAGTPPDLLFNPMIDLTLIPKLAWENKLADVTDVIAPLKNQFDPAALQAVFYQNSQTKQRSYYAVPIAQQTNNIHYWRDMVTDAGFDPNAIPQDWQGFWSLWQKSQTALRQKGMKEIYGIGLPESPVANDTFSLFEQFLDAYNVKLVDPSGKLTIDGPAVRSGIAAALKEYAGFYREGYVPPQATDWANPDNNVTFLSRTTIMTSNPSLSIPGSQKEDEATYYQKMGSLEWPRQPDGQPVTNLAGFKQAIIFAGSPNQQAAKDLLSYIIRPANLGAHLKQSQGRYFPVMPELLKDPFWNDPKDPHISVAVKQFKRTRPFYQVFNPAYTEVQASNVWGKALKSIAKEGVSPEQAADRAIEDIKQIFSKWQ